ncbi:MAG: response regulator transcription factor [Alphaproteobacteria bacterium]|nr:response regulator transcription factor [Alphaproteobacteria bacterium]
MTSSQHHDNQPKLQSPGTRVGAPEYLIIDPHMLFRRGLAWILAELTPEATIYEASNLLEGQEILLQQPDISLTTVEWDATVSNPGRMFHNLREAYPTLRLAAVTARTQRSEILRCLEAGVHGYIPKAMEVAAISNGLRMILNGAIYMPPSLAETSCDSSSGLTETPGRGTPRTSELTPRQREVLLRLLSGRTTKEIARDLKLAEGTIKIHLAAVFRFMGARNRTEAAARASEMQMNGSLVLDRSMVG